MSDHDQPAPTPAPGPDDEARRQFMLKLSLGLSGAAALAAGVPVVSALLAPLLQPDPQTWRKVGTLADFAVGSTHLVRFENADPVAWSGVSSESAAWLRRDSEHAFTAFSVNCAHLGCPVRWEAGAGLFMCPCHGGIYYKDGTVAAGPPPRGLSQYRTRISGQDVELLTAPVPITNISS